MDMLIAILNVLLVLALAVWSYLVFAMVMEQRRDAGRRSGQVFGGLRDEGLAWLHWLRSSAQHRARWRLVWATLILLAIIAARALVT